MGWEPGRLTDGQLATWSSLDTLFSGAKTYIDDLDAEALVNGCFNEDHFASQGVLFDNFGTLESDDGDHVYTQANFTTAMEYTTAGGNNATRVPADNPGSNDRIVIGHADATGPYADGLAELLNSGAAVQLTDDGSNGILVLFNINLKDALDLDHVFFCLQFQLDSGSWYTIDSSERLVHLDSHVIGGAPDDHLNYDVSIVSLITRDAISDVGGDPDADTITGLRACVSGDSLGGDASIILNRYNLTGLYIFADEEP